MRVTRTLLRLRQQRRRDRRNLIGGLAGPEDHLGHAMPQRAVMIDLREAQILERQMTHAVERGVDVHGAGAHFFEQRAQLVLIHRKLQDSSGAAVSAKPPGRPCPDDTRKRGCTNPLRFPRPRNRSRA